MTKTEVMKKLGLHSDLELLECLPIRYEPMTPTREIPQALMEPGQPVRLQVEIIKVTTLLKQGIIRFTARGLQSGHLYSFIVFHQMFYLNRVATGRRVFVTAIFSPRSKQLSVRGIFELDNRFVRAGLRPVYRLPRDVSRSGFERTIEGILNSDSINSVQDVIPADLMKKYHLLPRRKAFYKIHLPANERDMKLGLRVFQYEQCLSYCVTSLANRKYLSMLKKGTIARVDIRKLNDLVKATGYTLTGDQVRAIREIVDDMNSDGVMFRLLEGDVSTGKTLVALFALYANYLRGGQGTLVAPTQALAQQHCANALRILAPMGVKIALLSAKMKAGEHRKLLADLAEGKIDVVITTHAGASEGVTYRSLKLVVIDEQQNFGVSQRASLIAKGGAVDTLMMTATPIPRTMLKIKSGDTQLSVLNEFPHGIVRRVETRLTTSDDQLIDRAILKAMERQRQIFVIVPRIDEAAIDSEEMGQNVSAKEVYERFAGKYGEKKVQLLHGRMKALDQNNVLARFESGEAPILVSTSVVEVGMDIQRAGLMIIYSANLFGLSALHQLRGRIGRDGSYALCLLVYDGREVDVKAKLAYVAEHDNGFDIAQYDAESRGTGSLAGLNQSGSSDLAIADFVGNVAMLECAAADAERIIASLNTDVDYAAYARRVLTEKTIRDALLA